MSVDHIVLFLEDKLAEELVCASHVDGIFAVAGYFYVTDAASDKLVLVCTSVGGNGYLNSALDKLAQGRRIGLLR